MAPPVSIGFVGLGHMGASMAERLLIPDVRLHVHDTRQEAMEPFVQRGATACASPAMVANSAEIVFASLPNPRVVGVPQAGEDEFLRLPVYMNRGSENNLLVLSADGVRSFDVTPPGQSGFVAPDGTRSPHYDDQLALFGAFELKPQAFTRSEVTAAAAGRMTLPGAGP